MFATNHVLAPTVKHVPLLTIDNLCKSFGGVEAVRDVSFDVRLGQMVAMIGSNGAGKTTTFNCINGQLHPNSGCVIYNPNALSTAERIAIEESGENLGHPPALHNIMGLPPRRIANLGIGRTFQITATFASMIVRENVQMAMIAHHRLWKRLYGRADRLFRDEAEELLTTVGLSGQEERHTATLAYGDLKRLELAMALATHPKLLLMDEPTAGMGGEERDALMQLVYNLAKTQGIGVLFTEHDMDAVFGYADYIIVMHRGRVIAKGNAAAIQSHPQVREVYLGKEYKNVGA